MDLITCAEKSGWRKSMKRIGETGEPWGRLPAVLSAGLEEPAMRRVTSRSERKLATHRSQWAGRPWLISL
jgi:hypothetical protein